MTWELIEADCLDAMREMDEASVDAIVTDAPYGLEFMGRDWDRLDGGWRDGGGTSKPGIGERETEWPAYGGETANPTCAACGGRLRGERRCACAEPDWRVRGEPWDPEARAASRAQLMGEWHLRWAREALRVLKPGGHLLAFGGTRTYHRLACAVEDAGFEIRDSVMWLYGSGFPKSLDASKAVDAALGAERTEVVGVRPGHEDFLDRTDDHAAGARREGWDRPWKADPEAVRAHHLATAPATPEAAAVEGWGTALKPAHEPIVVARKPLAGTVARNLLEHGTGALNVRGCAVRFSGEADEREAKDKNRHGDFDSAPRNVGDGVYGEDHRTGAEVGNYDAPGRWPANVVLSHLPGCEPAGEREVASDGHYPGGRGPGGLSTDGHGGQGGLEERHTSGESVPLYRCAPGCPVAELDRQSGEKPASFRQARTGNDTSGWGLDDNGDPFGYGDTGGASRFFYTAKASRAERDAGLEGVCPGCHSPLGWEREDQPQATRAGTATRPGRATTESGAPLRGDSGSPTTSPGRPPTDRFQTDTPSTTGTETSRTTDSETSSSLPPSTTSASTRRTTDGGTAGDGSDAAASAGHGNPPTRNTSTSRERVGSPTDGADPATSGGPSRISDDAVLRCRSCGGVVEGALRNAHPT